MHKNKKIKIKSNYLVKVKSKIHPEIYHTILIDLHCYEQMPEEKKLWKPKKNKNKMIW